MNFSLKVKIIFTLIILNIFIATVYLSSHKAQIKF
jgi:hypothetical protein